MSSNYHFQQIAVLGAGVMGAQIAAHCANAGIPVFLYDLPAEGPNKNAIVDQAIARLTTLKPSPIASASTVTSIAACNYEEHLEQLRRCDLVIEAIGERLDWKEDLYHTITPHLSQHAVLVSNTSGLSIGRLSEILPRALQKNFCGVHFFNPPRYMHLAELIPSKTTPLELLDALETWLTRYLGKGVVRAKDTPNFIANRVGVFSMLSTMHHAQRLGLGLDEVDALTGALLGRPKSATFRTMDVVGLDTMQHVVHTMQEQLKDDPWHRYYGMPDWLQELIQSGHLGQKSGQGLYRKKGKNIEVFDYTTKEYRPSAARIEPDVQAALKKSKEMGIIKALGQSDSKQALFLQSCFIDLFHYCAVHLADISDTCREVDLAIRWGFGWQSGPFETWQQSDVSFVKQAIEQRIAAQETMVSTPLPEWLSSVDVFYGAQGAYTPQSQTLKARSSLGVYKRQYFRDALLAETIPSRRILYENAGVQLWDLNDSVAVLSFVSKSNTIGEAVIDGMMAALDVAEANCQGLVVYQNNPQNFSSGADLSAVNAMLESNNYDAVSAMIRQFQQALMRLKYSPIPVVAALRGRALGGGCELLMHCDAIVAAFESYPGLVELGVGVIPAGGGCTAFALRAAEKAIGSDILMFVQPYYEQIAKAVIARSAVEARERGFLLPGDSIVMHSHEVLLAAKQKIHYMQDANYLPPQSKTFAVAGREGAARLKSRLVNWKEGGFILEHDYCLVAKLAEVICGGDVHEGTKVDEQWMLALEREAFVELIMTKASQARIQHILETGKPLRN